MEYTALGHNEVEVTANRLSEKIAASLTIIRESQQILIDYDTKESLLLLYSIGQ